MQFPFRKIELETIAAEGIDAEDYLSADTKIGEVETSRLKGF